MSVQVKRELYKNSKNYRKSLDEQGLQEIKDKYGMFIIPEKKNELKFSEIQQSHDIRSKFNLYKSINNNYNNEYYTNYWANYHNLNLNEDISKIEENDEFKDKNDIYFEEDEYEEDEDGEDFESYCDFSEKEMLENASALPLKLLNINNLDYVQLRDMIRRETKKRRTTKKHNTLKKSQVCSAELDRNPNQNGLDLTKSKLDDDINHTGKEKFELTSTKINSKKQSKFLTIENIEINNNENKKTVLSDQTHIMGNNTMDITTRNTNLYSSSFINVNVSSLSEPKLKKTKTEQEKDRCNLI